MSAQNRNVKHLSCEYTGSSDTSSNNCSTCAENTGIGTLGAAEAKFHNAVTLCSITYTGCFGSDETLMVHDIQDSGFHELSFHNRCDNLYHRLTGKDYGTFWNGINITAETEVAQVFQKIIFKDAQASEVFDILFGKAQVFNVFNHLLQSGTDCEAAAAWIVTVKHIKDNSLVGWVFEITLHHGQFIEIGEQSKIVRSHVNSPLVVRYKMVCPAVGMLPAPCDLRVAQKEMRFSGIIPHLSGL